jgi:hypothetical protein
MKPECNVNINAVTNIVNEMMAEKNKLGRQAFKHMTGETVNEGETPMELISQFNSMSEPNDVVNAAVKAISDALQSGKHSHYMTKDIRHIVVSCINWGMQNAGDGEDEDEDYYE